MEEQTDISEHMRWILIDWLVEVHYKFKLLQETLFIAVYIIDKYLSFTKIKRSKLQTIGITALFIAAKYEEIYPPELREFSDITDRACSKAEILQMEGEIINALNFQITVPSSYRFAEWYTRLAELSPQDSCLVFYFIEVALLDTRFLKYSPSNINLSETEKVQETVANLNEELEKTKRALESNNQYLNKMSFQTQLAGLNLNQTQLLDKLEKCIQSNGEENEINLLLDSLRFRLGATGKERITAINYFFKQILDICIPTHFRYLLYTADAEEDMFADNPFSPEQINKRPDWRKELIQYVDINDSQRQKILKFKKKFKSEKKNLDDLIISLQQIKKSIQEKTYSLEHMVDSLRNYMNPMQSAKFLSFMERNRYRKEISNTSLWQALKAEDQEGDDYEEDNISQNNDPNSQLHLLCQQTQQQLYFQQQYNQPQLGFNNSGFLGDFQNPYGPPPTNGFQNSFYGGMPNPQNLMGNGPSHNPHNPQFSSQNSAFNYHQNQSQNNINGGNILHQGMMPQSLSEFSTKIETGSLPRKKLKSNNSMSQDQI